MPAPLATADDVVNLWRALTTAETDRADNLIVDASAELRSKLRDIDIRIGYSVSDPDNARALNPRVVASVVATIVVRAMVNPEGLSSANQTVGPYSETRSYAGRGDTVVRGGLRVLPEDLARLAPAQSGSPYGSIRLHPALAPSVGDYGPLPDPFTDRR